MVKTIRVIFLSLTILAFLLFSAVGTTVVYADDGAGTPETETTPTPDEGGPAETEAGDETPATDVEQPPDEETQPVEETASEEEPPAIEGEQPPAEETQPVEEPAVEETLQTILEQVPDNTTVTVLNSEGEAQPLASQESADAIASAYDPIWCPAGQVPTPGENGCTQSFSSFDELLSFLQANEGDAAYQQAGTIYIQQGTYLGGETNIDFNNYAFTQFNNYDLTLQGGWDTTYDPDVDGTPTFTTGTEFNVPITIGSSSNPWVGSLTINNISISGVSSQTGLTLYTQGNIELDTVSVTDSQTGAYLDAGGYVAIEDSNFSENKEGGADINAGGHVNILNSNFDHNGSKRTDGYGVRIHSGNEVNLSNMSASFNEIFGADVTAEGDVYIDASLFNGNKSYQYGIINDGYGLRVVSQGDITVDQGAVPGEGIEANDNFFFGAYLEGVNIYVAQSAFNANGSGNVENPIGRGLEVVSTGTVTLISLQANNNQLFGVNVGAVGAVTVTDSIFNSNQGYAYMDGWIYNGYGLQVITDDNIALDGVTANDNYLFGARLEGANVQVTNSFFNENDSDWSEHVIGFGLEVVSTGAVTLSGVEANNNQRFGANIQATGPVTVMDSFFNGNKAYAYSCKGDKIYYGYGIQIITDSEVSMVNVEAVGNYLFGAHIEGKDVAIDTANFSNNGSGNGLDLTGYGLEVISLNEVALLSVTANNNQLFGANIQAGDLVAISQSYFNGHIAYYYDYFNPDLILSRDGGYGLRVVTLGLIDLNQVTADGNYLYGAYLEGGTTTVLNSFFTANGSGVITEPTGYGLKIVSTGSVTLENINDADSVGNQLFGADVTAVEDVTILNSFFSGHQSVTFTPCLGLTFYGYGLNVVTQDDIFLNFVTANYNNLWGASLTGNNVSVYNSQFNNNVSDSNIFIDDTGLIVNAGGYVDIFRVEAKENRLIGATITAAGDVFITDSTFTDNRGFTCLYDWCPEGSIVYHGYGLQVTTPGLIQVRGTNASNNNLFGAELNGGLVTVENSIFDNNQFGNGLTVNATDNVTLTNVTATNNGGNGVEVNGVCEKVVQVNGGTFSDNALYGLKVLNATLNLDGAQTFANNGSGNVFTDTSTCVIVTPTVTTSTTNIQTTTPVVTTNTSNTNAETVLGETVIKKSGKQGPDKRRFRRAGR